MPVQECVDTHSGFPKHSTPCMSFHTWLCSLGQVARCACHSTSHARGASSRWLCGIPSLGWARAALTTSHGWTFITICYDKQWCNK